MKIQNVEANSSAKNIKFGNQRIYKNVISQLAKNNSYSLNELNQRRISDAIIKLGAKENINNADFFLEILKKIKYSTNIKLKHKPKHDWKKLLASATLDSLMSITGTVSAFGFWEKLNEIMENRDLSKEELEILDIRKNLLEAVDTEQVKNETRGPVKDFEKNLDYFIISSETTIEHKKYVLEKLKYFMSDEYKINPQLRDKKSIVVAEVINDLAVSVPDSEIPNIKAINQRDIGMCAAISIVRKKIAYENKPAYVDSILTELEDTPYMEVYDRTQLGTKKKVKVEKNPVDFETAMRKGFRIVDASTMHWMYIASMNGATNAAYADYVDFDEENFNVRKDTYFVSKIDDEELEVTQEYYNALLKAESVLKKYKSALIKKAIKKEDYRLHKGDYINTVHEIGNLLEESLKKVKPEISFNELRAMMNELLDLRKPTSKKIKKGDNYSYIPNEEALVKKEKIRSFLADKYGISLIDEKEFDNIFKFINDYQIAKSSLKNSYGKKYTYQKAKSLYNVGASFRYQILMGLNEEKTLNNMILKEKTPDKETSIINAIDEILIKLNQSDDEDLLAQLNPMFNNQLQGKEDAIDSLINLKSDINELLTTTLDDIYASIGLGSRRQALVSYIQTIKESAENNDKAIIKVFADFWGVNETKEAVIKELDKLSKQLVNSDEATYKKVSLKMGKSSQLSYLKNILESVSLNILEGSEDAKKLDVINNKISSMESFLNECREAIKIYDKDDNLLISADVKDLIIKRLENRHEIVSSKDLRELQSHFERIDYALSAKSFEKEETKLDKTLLQFSKNEKLVLDDIKKRINPMYASVVRQLNEVRNRIKAPLEELNRVIGVNTGDFWVFGTSSGVSVDKQVRILEYITGEPHYSTSDIKTAIEKIKNSAYSGIGSSQVDHDKFSGHAQYIADIKSVSVQSKDKDGSVKTGKREVLFHDNTWGASEKRNSWVDSNGILRTDYSSGTGGTLGFITDDNYRNGNLTSRILNEMLLRVKPNNVDNKIYKKINHINKDIEEDYVTPQYMNIVLQGKSSNVDSISGKIYEAMFMDNPILMMRKVKNKVQKLSEKEVEDLMNKLDIVDSTWEVKYERLMDRILPKFGKTILTKEEYEKLPDNDELKVLLEKVAVRKNYPTYGLDSKITKIKDVKDLKSIKVAQINRAINSFKYAFGKNIAVIDYLIDSFDEKMDNKIEDILEKHNVKLTDEQYGELFDSFKIDSDKFDGSIRKTIEILLEELSKSFDKIILSEEAKNELLALMEDFMTKTFYFNSNDISNSKLNHIIKFIDKEFKPESDLELVEIYNRLQDMTEEEFKSQVLSRVKNADLKIGNYTGYDVLQRLRFHDSKFEKSFRNALVLDHISLDTEINEPTRHYEYYRFTRTPMAKPKYDLKNLYISMVNDVSYLSYKKIFNKYKDFNIRKYNAFPAYPTLDYIGESINDSYQNIISSVKESVIKIKAYDAQMETYELNKKLKKLVRTQKPQKALNDSNLEEIKYIARRLIALGENDESCVEIIKYSKEILKLNDESLWAEYLPNIKEIIKHIIDMENTTSYKSLSNLKYKERLSLDLDKELFLKGNVQDKYKSRMSKLINEYEHYLVKKEEESSELQNEIYKYCAKYHILQEPEEVVKKYFKSMIKKSDLNKINFVFESYLKKVLDASRLLRVQTVLMKAIDGGLDIRAKDMFAEYKVKLKNKLTGEIEEHLLNSPKAVTIMVHDLMMNNDVETAQMFIEKLGFGEIYLKEICTNFNFTALNDCIKHVKNLQNQTPIFIEKVDRIIEEASEKLKYGEEDYMLVISQVKDEIINILKSLELDECFIEIFNLSFEELMKQLSKNAKADKNLTFSAYMASAKQKFASYYKVLIDSDTKKLKENDTLANFINGILVRGDSEAHKARLEFNEKFKKISESLQN